MSEDTNNIQLEKLGKTSLELHEISKPIIIPNELKQCFQSFVSKSRKSKIFNLVEETLKNVSMFN